MPITWLPTKQNAAIPKISAETIASTIENPACPFESERIIFAGSIVFPSLSVTAKVVGT
jgi:hypothetical protein